MAFKEKTLQFCKNNPSKTLQFRKVEIPLFYQTAKAIPLRKKLKSMGNKNRFSNSANRKIAEREGASLVSYNNNGDSLRAKAIELHEQGKVVYYENKKPSRQFPNGASHLYEVNAGQ